VIVLITAPQVGRVIRTRIIGRDKKILYDNQTPYKKYYKSVPMVPTVEHRAAKPSASGFESISVFEGCKELSHNIM